ncbi:MAG: hypothetical protein KA735_06065 [Burkholderiaceae bacterium]|nr:hypothetical protein [Burkholderiaceae bacterium]
MNKDLARYLSAPVGEQLLKHFENRAELRRTIPLFPFSFSKLFARKSHTDKARTHKTSHTVCHHH